MEKLIDIIATESFNLYLAGFLGGTVSAMVLRKKTLREYFIHIFAGAVVGKYFGFFGVIILEPTIGKITDVTDIDELGAFIVGIGGVAVVELIHRAWYIRTEMMKPKEEENDA